MIREQKQYCQIEKLLQQLNQVMNLQNKLMIDLGLHKDQVSLVLQPLESVSAGFHKEIEEYKRIEASIPPEIVAKVTEVFGDWEKGFQWLLLPNFAFGGVAPVDILQEPDGVQVVEDEVGRIEWGIFI